MDEPKRQRGWETILASLAEEGHSLREVRLTQTQPYRLGRFAKQDFNTEHQNGHLQTSQTGLSTTMIPIIPPVSSLAPRYRQAAF